jgi:hypothetical protein
MRAPDHLSSLKNCADARGDARVGGLFTSPPGMNRSAGRQLRRPLRTKGDRNRPLRQGRRSIVGFPGGAEGSEQAPPRASFVAGVRSAPAVAQRSSTRFGGRGDIPGRSRRPGAQGEASGNGSYSRSRGLDRRARLLPPRADRERQRHPRWRDSHRGGQAIGSSPNSLHSRRASERRRATPVALAASCGQMLRFGQCSRFEALHYLWNASPEVQTRSVRRNRWPEGSPCRL